MADGSANGTPGQRLRAAREARGADLEVAHESTKIPLRLIEAIERDEYHKLSGPLYVRSFLRSYAGWLGLDTGEILRAYESLAGRPESGGGDEMVWTEDQVQVRRVGSSLPRDLLIGAAVVVILALAAWGLWTIIRGGDTPSEPAAVPPEEFSVIVPPATAVDSVATPEAVGETGKPRPGRSALQPATRPETRQARLARLEADSLLGGPRAEATPPASAAVLPVPVAADAAVPFIAGTPTVLVLRVLLPAPTNCSVRRDDQAAARPVVWPDRPQPLPTRDVSPGVAYAVRNGFAIYWGARDTFTLTLGALQDARASLNGADLPVDRWQPGQPVVLDQHTVQRLGG
ncbi:MAG: helix-turn-helix domain-containing protein [Candidatus Krumholzibacteriia bacterium]